MYKAAYMTYQQLDDYIPDFDLGLNLGWFVSCIFIVGGIWTSNPRGC
jgi:hypothetical protein